MKMFALSLLLAVAAAACSGSTPASPTYVVPIVSTEANTGSPLSSTHLTGDHENPANASLAQGQAMLKVSADGRSVSYKIIASNIDNIVQSHIHMGSPATEPCMVVGRILAPLMSLLKECRVAAPLAKSLALTETTCTWSRANVNIFSVTTKASAL